MNGTMVDLEKLMEVMEKYKLDNVFRYANAIIENKIKNPNRRGPIHNPAVNTGLIEYNHGGPINPMGNNMGNYNGGIASLPTGPFIIEDLNVSALIDAMAATVAAILKENGVDKDFLKLQESPYFGTEFGKLIEPLLFYDGTFTPTNNTDDNDSKTNKGGEDE